MLRFRFTFAKEEYTHSDNVPSWMMKNKKERRTNERLNWYWIKKSTCWCSHWNFFSFFKCVSIVTQLHTFFFLSQFESNITIRFFPYLRLSIVCTIKSSKSFRRFFFSYFSTHFYNIQKPLMPWKMLLFMKRKKFNMFC